MKKFLNSNALKLFTFALYGKWTKYIGGKMYRRQNVSALKRIGGKTYQQQNVSAANVLPWRQNVSVAKRIGGKMYML
jgi:hypothetical protein